MVPSASNAALMRGTGWRLPAGQEGEHVLEGIAVQVLFAQILRLALFLRRRLHVQPSQSVKVLLLVRLSELPVLLDLCVLLVLRLFTFGLVDRLVLPLFHDLDGGLEQHS